MAYEKQTWINKQTPLDAEHMNHIEEGIAAAHEALANLPEAPETPDVPADVTVDATLTQPGAAADAAVVGEKIGELSEEMLPTTDQPHMQLVTDASGTAKWEDKPFSSTPVNFEWDGDESNPIYDQASASALISDSITTLGQLDGLNFVLSQVLPPVSTYDLPSEDEDAPRKFDSEVGIVDTSNAQYDAGMYMIRLEASCDELSELFFTDLMLVVEPITIPNGMVIKPGLYVYKEPGYEQTFVSKLYGESVKTIDPKYLPAGVGSSGGVIAITGDLRPDATSKFSCNVPFEKMTDAILAGFPVVYVHITYNGDVQSGFHNARVGKNHGENVFRIQVFELGADMTTYSLVYSAEGLAEKVIEEEG